MPELKYSTDQHDFKFDTIDEAMKDLFASEYFHHGESIVIYSGEPELIPASSFVPNIIESMSISAGDSEYYEWLDDFPNVSQEIKIDIQVEVEALICKLFKHYDIEPRAYLIHNVKEVNILIEDEGLNLSWEDITVKKENHD